MSISTVDDSNVNLPNFISKTNNHIEFMVITEQEICDVTRNLEIKKAAGPDEISHRMLHETSLTLCKPLCILFNKSLQEGVYPNNWKLANVMPLFKKGQPNLPSNYRPISLISCIGKVMERIIFKHIYNHLHTNNLIYKHQSGFIPGHSTVYQLIDIYHQICTAIDEKKSTCIVFCDISKAFDRVWHTGLYFKLRQYGINGRLLRWINDYLTNRCQRVFVETSYSDIKHITAGVPQGSVLGPLFFLIYVNDIADNLDSITRLFADDSSISDSSANINSIELKINKDLQSLLDWSKQWLVNFNPAKTEAMFFSFIHTVNRPLLYFDNVQLNFVEHHKHLGLTFSQNGTWHEHIYNTIKTASKVLGSMRALKFKLKRTSLNQIYISYMRPILEYASVVWDGCTLYEKSSLEKLQYEAARIVTGLTRSVSIVNLLKEIGWVSLSDRRIIQKLIIVYKLKHEMLPCYLEELFPHLVNEQTPYNLRNNDNFQTIARRTELYSKSYIPSAISLWNNLDNNTKESESLLSFKSKMKLLYKPPEVPPYYLVGDRLLSVMHSRLRNGCSNLNADLFRNHLSNSPSCNCGHNYEDANHFLLNCNQFHNQRIALLRSIDQFHPLTVNILLHGNTDLGFNENKYIFLAVQNYISKTGRFI